ncbi:MAG: glycosyltransferase family 39 protein [Phycisphaerae bacterium]|nr:MAG: phospholipid carrier-dependent glycosyltransferase [Planctomycetota bacterium]KAB2949315.1 MAG: phospholipid carrier-dependent glycosyltransferase [Phycisphaerae bacterium]MBE7455317.1 glycosyltransferase family 39 protein [Planctomycetia bacterium]MCK6464129.1 glycosyltransferase family 39 protein [Phycisphaerae bacterium]MCL4717697.1 glycosyltransferase family 39 protein [Phycisphaerae bacterium]
MTTGLHACSSGGDPGSSEQRADPGLRRGVAAAKAPAVLLAAVLCLAGALRLTGVSEVGLRYADGSWYASDARLWHRCAKVAADPLSWYAVFRQDKAFLLSRLDAHGVDRSGRYAKPCQGYTLLVAAMMTIVGDTPSAGPITNAVLSTMSVGVLFVGVRRLLGDSVAFLAALLLALSPYDLVYARADLADPAATFFVLSGVLLWANAPQDRVTPGRRLLITGVALGLAATCHYRSVLFVSILFGIDAARVIARGAGSGIVVEARRLGARWTWIGFGCVLPVAALETFFQSGALAARMSDAFFPFQSFVGAAWHWIGLHFDGDAKATPDLGAIAVYAGYLVRWQGWVFVGLTGIGVIICIRRGFALCVAGIAPVLVILSLLFQPYHVARALSVVVPMMCVCAAVGAATLARVCSGGGRMTAAGALAGALLAPLAHAGYRAAGVMKHRSGLAPLVRELASSDGAILVPNVMLYQPYAEPLGLKLVSAEEMPRVAPDEAIRWMIEHEVTRVVLDPQHWHCDPRSDEFRFWERLEAHLRAVAAPSAQFPHLSDYRWEFLAEGPGCDRLADMIASDAGPLRVYEVRGAGGGLTDRRVER